MRPEEEETSQSEAWISKHFFLEHHEKDGRLKRGVHCENCGLSCPTPDGCNTVKVPLLTLHHAFDDLR